MPDLDKEYQDYLDDQEYQHYQTASAQAANPRTVPDAASKAAAPGKQFLDQGMAEYHNNPIVKMQHAALGDPKKFTEAASSITGMGGLPAYLTGSMATRVGTNTVLGATQGAINNPEDRLGGGLMGGVAGFGASVAGEGGAKAADWGATKLMKAATGVRESDKAKRLLDLLGWGSRGNMTEQVNTALPGAEQKVQDTIGSIGHDFEGKPIQDAVSKVGNKFVNPDKGLPFESKEASYNQVRDISDKLAGTESYSPQALLKLKRASDWEGYTAAGNPATSLKAEIEQAQANQARQMLENATQGASKEALANEGALLSARTSLKKSENGNIPLSLNQLARSLMGGTAGMSAGAQALHKGVAKPLQGVVDPVVLQSLFNKAEQ